MGTTHAIIAGEGGHHTPSKGTFDNPAFADRPFTFEIKGQNGRRFWGKIWMNDKSDSAEPFVGALAIGGRQFMLADTDGYTIGQNKAFDGLRFQGRSSGRLFYAAHSDRAYVGHNCRAC